MFDLLFEIIVILFLGIEIWLIYMWAKEHQTVMSIIAHTLSEIRKKLP
jgi:hypothetical protein